VKNGAELLDRLVKDIVSDQASYYPPELVKTNVGADDPLKDVAKVDTIQTLGSLSLTISEQAGGGIEVPGSVPLGRIRLNGKDTFNLPRFIPLLSERINVLNPFTRMFFVQWINVLASVPDLELLSYLPSFLDGIFGYLDDESGDVRVGALGVLNGFLKDIREVVNLQRARGGLNLASDGASDEGHANSVASVGESEEVKTEAEMLPPGIDDSRPYAQGSGILIDFKRMTEILIKNLGSTGIFLDLIW
jgi:vacuole morphology and inheritance protein 14